VWLKLTCSHNTRNECVLFDKIIIVDTNYVIDLVEAVSKCINTTIDWRRQLNFFESSFQSYLDKSCKCSPLNRINTSNLILNNELDITRDNTSIRRKSRFLRDVDRQYNRSISGPFYSRIWSIMSSKIEGIIALDIEIDALKGVLRTSYRISDEDLSLIVSAVKKSNEVGDTCVVTGDVNLENALKDVCAMGSVDLPSGRVRTDRILPLNIYTYLSLLHKCCELSNEEHSVLFKYLVGEDMERSYNMGARIKRIKRAQFDRMFDLREETRRIKETLSN